MYISRLSVAMSNHESRCAATCCSHTMYVYGLITLTDLPPTMGPAPMPDGVLDRNLAKNLSLLNVICILPVLPNAIEEIRFCQKGHWPLEGIQPE